MNICNVINQGEDARTKELFTPVIGRQLGIYVSDENVIFLKETEKEIQRELYKISGPPKINKRNLVCVAVISILLVSFSPLGDQGLFAQ